MKIDALTIVTCKDDDYSPEEIAEFLFLVRAVYGEAVTFCSQNRIGMSEFSDPSSKYAKLFEKHLQSLRPIGVDRLFSETSTPPLMTKSISRSSPWEFVLYGVLPAIVLAIIVSGGKLAIPGLRCEINALGDGIAKLKKALRISSKGRGNNVRFGLQSSRFRLSLEEFELLMNPVRGSGGYQSFLRVAQAKVTPSTHEISLTNSEIQLVAKCITNPSAGGFQSRITKIFARHL